LAPGVAIVDPPAFDLAAAADLVLCASGTATVEVCLANTPMVVMYRLSPLSYAIAKRLVTLPHVAMVNLIAEERLVPELLQDAATPEAVAGEASRLLANEEERRAITRGYARVRDRLAGGVGVDAVAEKALALSRGGS
jgi:lipid-A-disaccharide synthase